VPFSQHFSEVSMVRSYICLVFLILLFPSAAAVHAQQPVDSMLVLSDEPMALLAGHITARFPVHALTAIVSQSAPSTDGPDTREMRVNINTDFGAFLLNVRELYKTATDDFPAAAARYAQNLNAFGELDVEPFEIPGSPLEAVALIPPQVDSNANVMLVMGFLLAHPDGTVQEALFLAGGDMAPNIERARTLVQTIASSFNAGSRRVEAPGGPTTLGGQLMVLMPPNMVMTSERKGGYALYRMQMISPIDEVSAGITVYVGTSPVGMYQRSGSQVPADTLKHVVFEHERDWTAWIAPVSDVMMYHAETIVDYSHDDGIYMHVFVVAPTEADRDRLLDVAGTLWLRS
jgi:hypothetical protein